MNLWHDFLKQGIPLQQGIYGNTMLNHCSYLTAVCLMELHKVQYKEQEQEIRLKGPSFSGLSREIRVQVSGKVNVNKHFPKRTQTANV